MIYLIIHLSIGVALIGTVLIQLYFERRRSKSAHDLLATQDGSLSGGYAKQHASTMSKSRNGQAPNLLLRNGQV